jgi:long-chain fatty acid transport protein
MRKASSPSRWLQAALLSSCALFLPPRARAASPVHGARAAGMGTAFVAVADDPTAMVYNPAGLTQVVGTQIYAGLVPIIPSTSYRDPSGASQSTRAQVFPAPYLFGVSDMGAADWRFGLAVFSPYGVGGRTWDAEGATRYLSIESTVATILINPTLACRVLPTLSIGAGFDYMFSQATARRRLDQSSLGAPDAELELEGSGRGWGYNLGLLFAPLAELSFGLSYRSGIDVTHAGDATIDGIAPPLQGVFGGPGFKTGARTAMSFPSIVSFGMAYRPSADLTLAADVEQTRWSSFRTSSVQLERQVSEAGFTDATAPLDWRNAWSAKVGTEWRATARLALRAGYAYVQTPVPDATLDPSNPDSNLHALAVGGGYRARGWTVDVSYTAGIYEDRIVSNGIMSGTYSNVAHFVGVGVGWRSGGR